jgi:hypothetical protein
MNGAVTEWCHKLGRLGHALPGQTVKDLRGYAGRIQDADDRELVQHAADLLEVLAKYIHLQEETE